MWVFKIFLAPQRLCRIYPRLTDSSGIFTLSESITWNYNPLPFLRYETRVNTENGVKLVHIGSAACCLEKWKFNIQTLLHTQMIIRLVWCLITNFSLFFIEHFYKSLIWSHTCYRLSTMLTIFTKHVTSLSHYMFITDCHIGRGWLRPRRERHCLSAFVGMMQMDIFKETLR